MKPSSSSVFDELESIYGRTLDLIHSTLTVHYQLSEDEARGAEEDLRAWFRRLARRGTTPTPVRILQIALLSAACQYGRSFQFWKLRGAPSSDRRLNEFLARKPDDVAIELQSRIDKEQA